MIKYVFATLAMLMVLSVSYAVTYENCEQTTCEQICQSYYDKHKDDVHKKLHTFFSLPFLRLCGDFPKPQDRRDCLNENIADYAGVSEWEMNDWYYKQYINSDLNPVKSACLARNDALSVKSHEEDMANMRRENEKKAEEERVRQEEADAEQARVRAIVEQQEAERLRQIQAEQAMRNAQVDILNKQAEQDFRTQGMMNGVLNEVVRGFLMK